MREVANSPSIVPRLAAELRQRLAELDRERSVIEATLTALGGVTRPQPKARRRPATLDERIQRVLRDEPGTRASMLAEVEGVTVDAVMARLQIMEQERSVSRDGLGWRLLTE